MLDRNKLFDPLWAWTVFTTIFAWLPMVRILGRPEGYTWRVLGLSGEGTDGPFWVFVVATAFVVTMLYAAHRASRTLFYPMLVGWHLFVAGIFVVGVVSGGADAEWQGQGLHWSVPMWAMVVPFVAFAALAVVWSVLDYRAGGAPAVVPWNRANTRRLVISGVLLAVALALFHAGTNYNWVTAVAIVATVLHWILLAESFKPVRASARDVGNVDDHTA